MDLLVKDLDEKMTVAGTEEKNAQAAYEQTIADAADKRRQDSKSLTDKEAAKADSQGALEQSTGEKKDTSRSLMGTRGLSLTFMRSAIGWLSTIRFVRTLEPTRLVRSARLGLSCMVRIIPSFSAPTLVGTCVAREP